MSSSDVSGDRAAVRVKKRVTQGGARPFGWYCELVHIKSGVVINSNFFTDSPLTGSQTGKPDCLYEWRATPVFASPPAKRITDTALAEELAEAQCDEGEVVWKYLSNDDKSQWIAAAKRAKELLTGGA